MSKKATIFAIDLTTGTGYVPAEQTREIERGALVSLVLSPRDTGVRIAEIYCRVDILSGGTTDMHSAAILIEDYVYNQSPANWEGLYILTAQSRIRLTGWTEVARTVRLTGTINIDE